MTRIISITDLRKNLFNLAEMIVTRGEEIEIEKEGKRIIKLVRINDDPKERAKKVLNLLPKLANLWKDIPDKKMKEMNEFFRGKKEKQYMADLGRKS